MMASRTAHPSCLRLPRRVLTMVTRAAALVVTVAVLLPSAVLAQSAGREGASKPLYVFAGAFLAHPYVRDIKLGLRYAEKKLGVTVRILGPQGPDFKAQATALAEAIEDKPAGIIVPLWGADAVPRVKEAREKGIPVIAIEAAPPDHGADTYIGLDNYQSGLMTARELIRRGGRKGKLALVLNRRSNTVLKRQGLIDGLAGTDWEIVAEAENDSSTDDATRVSIELLRAQPEITGLIGLNSSAGVGIGNAIGQLGLADRRITTVVHDREEIVLEMIERGLIEATIVSKTALMSYLAVSLLEDYRKRRARDVPVVANADAIGIVLLPETVYIGAVVVERANVRHFLRGSLPGLVE